MAPSLTEAALNEPVTITSHGRERLVERLVLLSAEEYHRLERHDRAALYPPGNGARPVGAAAAGRS